MGRAERNSIMWNEEDHHDGWSEGNLEWIMTIESIANDWTLTPNSKQKKKLANHIKLTFMKTGEAPVTTSEFYRIGKILGKGAFGKVNLAMHWLTEKLVAIKSINKNYLKEDSSKRKVMQEVYILKKIKHPSVIRLFETFETKKHILFVIEMCSGGDLLNYVRKRRRLKEDVAKYMFK